MRRVVAAISFGDPLLRGDPRRRRLDVSLLASFVLAGLILGGVAVYGFIRPVRSIGHAAVVIDRDTGGVYVSRAGRLYPALNLSSALLAAGRGQNNGAGPSRATVDTATIAAMPRGPIIGIPGAPDVVPSASKSVDPRWTVCDRRTGGGTRLGDSTPTVQTTAIIGQSLAGSIGKSHALLVSADDNGTTFLVWDGHRAKIDPTDAAIRLAFGLGADVTAQPVSAALLDAIPRTADLAVPSIDTSGRVPSYVGRLGVSVGSVFALVGADGSRSVYVALSDGVEQVSPLVADLVRAEFDARKAIELVAPRLLRQSPRSTQIVLADYPTVRPEIRGSGQSPVTCVTRSTTSTDVFTSERVPLPSGARPVAVAEPGGLGVDAVYVQPGGGAVFSETLRAPSRDEHEMYLLTDDGVAYPIATRAALTSLGFAVHDVRTTGSGLLAMLPHGPTLDPDQAARFFPRSATSIGSLPAA